MFTFSDSSWNDVIDIGHSTGSYLIYYMEGIIDHSSNMPDPIAIVLQLENQQSYQLQLAQRLLAKVYGEFIQPF